MDKGKTERVFAVAALAIIATGAILLLIAIVKFGDTPGYVQQTSAYTRVTNCIVGKSADRRVTQAEVEKCYVQVEKDTGVSLERFDKQTNE